ncbi:MAG: 5'-nucleotidase (lipoprotein e(P4) family) [Paracoccaceae bacterium]|jgi:5'-nucleotidase (lipoprotein e(P4) family)
MRYPMIQLFLRPVSSGLALGLLTLAGCAAPLTEGPSRAPVQASAPSGTSSSNALLLATLYCNTSAEYAAACLSTYRAAELQLPALLQDVGHTGALEQAGVFSSFPTAIVLDVDETVLDNSPSEVRLIQTGTSYPEGWDAWCMEGQARPVPGALEFTNRAAELGVTVFYVTNRKAHLKAATLQNLIDQGFPMKANVDTLFMRGDRPEWQSDKTNRREAIAAEYRIVMLFGDNTGDFLGLDQAQGTAAERLSAVEDQSQRWGRSWFMLPNPMYGYWDGAALGYDYNRPTDEINALRLDAMDAGTQRQ